MTISYSEGNNTVTTTVSINTGRRFRDLAIGSIIPVSYYDPHKNSIAYNFVVINQGNPDSTIYDSSCNGTWVMMTNVYDRTGFFHWSSSEMQTDIFNSCVSGGSSFKAPDSFQSLVKQVKIPYYDGSVLHKGSDGFSARAFILSASEIGDTSNGLVADGVKLPYFTSVEKRIATYRDGTSTGWWLRSQNAAVDGYTGNVKVSAYGNSGGLRPVMILQPDAIVKSYY